MSISWIRGAAGTALLSLVLVTSALATKVKQMNLAQLTANAGSIVRGTVVGVVQIGARP